MTTLFHRAATLNVQGKVLEGIDYEFRIDRSLSKHPNTADFTVYNLSEANRKYLQQCAPGCKVELHAGYASDAVLPLIFLGELREVRTVRNGSDWQTEISSGDADEQKKRPVSFSLGPGTAFDNAVKKLTTEMGAKVGNLGAALRKGKFSDASKEFTNGLSVFGNGDQELDKLLRSGGLEHSWQNGELQVLPIGKALNTVAVTLDEGSGLIGSPESGEKGKVKFRSLLNADISPGRIVHVIARNLDVFVRTERAVYSGQIAGTDWYVDVEGSPLTVVR